MTTPDWPVELLTDERDRTCAGFWRRAQAFFAGYNITVRRVLTDNGPGDRSRAFAAVLAEHQVGHSWTRPYRPQPNAKVERFNRTLLQEWAYRRPYRSQTARARPCQHGSTATPITAPTPPSAATHPSTQSTTSRVNTPSPRYPVARP